MIKKLIVVAVVGGLAVAAVSKTKFWSHIRSEVKSWREAAEEQIPPEKEIARLREEVKYLDADIKKVVKEQAKLEQERDEMVARKKTLEKNLPGMRERLAARAGVAESAEQRAKAGEKDVTVQFGPDDKPISLTAAKVKLSAWVEELVAAEKEVEHLTKQIESRNRIIAKLDEKQAAMKKAKGELESAIDDLEEQLLDLQIQQTESKYQTDDTRLSRIKQDIEKQRKRIDLQKRELAKMQGEGSDAATKSVKEITGPAFKTDTSAAATAPTAATPPTMPRASD
jgi:chromosome segregation ATPase